MLEDLFDDFLILDKADDPHGALAFRAGEWIHFIYFLNQSGPILPIRLETFVRFQDARNPRISARFLAFPAANVAVIVEVPNHLLALVGHMGTPVCVRHAQAGMAASHSRALKVLFDLPMVLCG